MNSDLAQLESKIGFKFKNVDLFKESVTHRSYLNENPSWKLPHNERLEFLGDAVLELIITEHLFKVFPKHDEGQLTSFRAALVNYQMLARIAREVELEKHILLSRGETKDTGRAREVILANAIESFIGAIYLDSDYATVYKFVEKYVINHLDEVIKEGSYKDPKSLLQEIIQEKFKVTPSYKVLDEHGPDHAKIFQVGVFYDDKLIAEGTGSSKQEAEVAAAQNALKTEHKHKQK